MKDSYRIALCFSGQSRTWESTKESISKFFSFPAVHPVLNTPVLLDVFIHTWDINTYRQEGETSLPTRVEKNNDQEKIKNYYSPKIMEVEHFDKKKFPFPWDGLFHSFMKSILLKKRWEIENNFTYDLVIKMRLDIVFQDSLLFSISHPIEQLTAYPSQFVHKFPSELGHNCFDDVFFYSDSPTMDIISNVCRVEKNFIIKRQYTWKFHNIDDSVYYGPGTILYRHLIDRGIYPYVFNFYPYCVYREEAQKLKLNPITDYEEIRQIGVNWYSHIKTL